MTKTQIWVAAFLGVFLILFGISYIGRDQSPSSSSGPMMGGGGGQVEQANRELSAMDLIKSNGCTGCHGQDLKGTRMAPALENLKANWSRDELVNYLRNPSSYMDKGRFREFRQKYPQVVMPSFSHLDIKDLGKIADYLIKL